MNFSPQNTSATVDVSTQRKIPNISSREEMSIFCCLKTYGDIMLFYNCKETENKTRPQK